MGRGSLTMSLEGFRQVEEMTLRELQRMVESHDRRFADYIRADLYARDLKGINNDIAEIRTGQDRVETKLARLQNTMISALVALIVNLLIQLAQNIQIP